MVDAAPNQHGEPRPARTPEEARQDLQAILGALHGLLSKAVDCRQNWCPSELRDAIGNAFLDIGLAFGRVQADLNSGAHDDRLGQWGLGGVQMEPKKQGFWSALRRFFDPTRRGQLPYFGAFGSALRWGALIVGSLSREIPGGEVIHEFVES